MTPPGYQRFFAELKRRRVFRVMAVYGVVAFGIIEAADAIFPRMALPDWTVTLVVWLALLGFPVTIVLAWALEMTPDGVRRTAEAAPGELTEIIAAPAPQRWSAGVLALVGVTALLAGAWYVGRQSAPPPDAAPAVGISSASIAVLPFADMSPDKDQEYFSDGISEELLNLLTKVPELQVTARTSSFSFKDQNLEIPEIAERLNVAHVLEGSVRKAGNQVRITVQLIRAADGFHVWSETWDRTLDDIFAIQDEIAAEVVAQLKVTLLGEAPKVEETDPEAYALFLQARNVEVPGGTTEEIMEQVTALYLQGLAIDPDYAPAWVDLAQIYFTQANMGLRPVDESFRLSREAANRALAIDSKYALADASLGYIAEAYDQDLAVAARHYERALELAPTDTDIIFWAANLARNLDRLDEAIALLEYAVARDPVNMSVHNGLGLAYFFAGRLDEALASFRTMDSLGPAGTGFGQSLIGWVLLQKGEPEAALAALQQESSDGSRQIGLAMAYHALGRSAESDAALAEVIEKYEQDDQRWANNIAYVLAFRGEVDRAFEWLDRAVEYNDPGLTSIANFALFANLHDDPRWLPFLESIGKSPEQLAAIEFDVRLPQ
jgi:TolB-like protein/Flp pilus assembly protein TadD